MGVAIPFHVSFHFSLLFRSTESIATPLHHKLALTDKMNDYHNKFSPSAYLETRYSKSPGEYKFRAFVFQQLHSFFDSVTASGSTDFKVLDYGCGPAIANVISAARVATEVIFAEYTEKNRTEINHWIENDPSAWNWGPHFEYIVQTMEGKGAQETIEREKRLRSTIRAVVPCDITQDPPIAEGFEGPYDVVLTILSMEAGCSTLEEYKAAVKRVSKLIKPAGGVLLLYSPVRNDTSRLGSYTVGAETFNEISVPLEFVYTTLKDANLEVTATEFLPAADVPAHMDAAPFIVARRL